MITCRVCNISNLERGEAYSAKEDSDFYANRKVCKKCYNGRRKGINDEMEYVKCISRGTQTNNPVDEIEYIKCINRGTQTDDSTDEIIALLKTIIISLNRIEGRV